MKSIIKKILNKGVIRSISEYPQEIILEPTNACNLRCKMCPGYGEGVLQKREIGFIKKDLWVSAIDEIGSWPANINLDVHGLGEPLLHHDFFNIISYAKSKRNISAGFLCNATLLDREKAKSAIELGVDWVCFSVDGAEKELFEYYRRGSDFEVVEENIKYLLSLRKAGKPGILFNAVRHEEIDIKKLTDKWAGLVDSITISIKRPVQRENNENLNLKRPCPLLYKQLAIGWTGKAGLCCEDLWIEYPTGEFPADSLYDIWHGRPLTKARKLHESGRYDKLHLCRTCNAPLFHQFKDNIIERDGRKTVVRIELPYLNPELAVHSSESSEKVSS